MRKIFFVSALAIAIAGCANHQGVPQVRDVSGARGNLSADGQYTVAQGDTLYGIAWQQGLDYRELAALNDIEPPYNIYPGQQIALQSSKVEVGRQVAQVSQPAPEDGETSEASGVVATGLGETPVQVAASVQDVDWLALMRRQVAKKRNRFLKEPDISRRRKKMFDYLVRKGYNRENIWQFLDQLLSDLEDE